MGTSSKRVFLLDDSSFALDLTRTALVECGFTVHCGRDLRDVDHAADGLPDLILLDVEMPEAFGDDVATYLVARGIHTPIYLLSSLGEEELRKRADDAGVAGFIPKRLGIDGVVARIHEILGLPGIGRSIAPSVLIDDFLSTAYGRLRRTLGGIERGETHAAAAELHNLSGEAALLGLDAIARKADAARAEIAHPDVAAMVSQLSTELDEVAERARVPRPSGRIRALRPQRILLLDDSDFFRTTLMAVLEDAGYEVIEVRRLAEARHKMHHGSYDLAILDRSLEDGRGSELIPELRRASPKTRIIVLSGDGGDPCGADAALTKDVPAEQLLARIETILRN